MLTSFLHEVAVPAKARKYLLSTILSLGLSHLNPNEINATDVAYQFYGTYCGA